MGVRQSFQGNRGDTGAKIKRIYLVVAWNLRQGQIEGERKNSVFADVLVCLLCGRVEENRVVG